MLSSTDGHIVFKADICDLADLNARYLDIGAVLKPCYGIKEAVAL